jgi:predicted nucleotide-binding protein
MLTVEPLTYAWAEHYGIPYDPTWKVCNGFFVPFDSISYMDLDAQWADELETHLLSLELETFVKNGIGGVVDMLLERVQPRCATLPALDGHIDWSALRLLPPEEIEVPRTAFPTRGWLDPLSPPTGDPDDYHRRVRYEAWIPFTGDAKYFTVDTNQGLANWIPIRIVNHTVRFSYLDYYEAGRVQAELNIRYAQLFSALQTVSANTESSFRSRHEALLRHHALARREVLERRAVTLSASSLRVEMPPSPPVSPLSIPSPSEVDMTTTNANNKTVFVVHGRNTAAVNAMFHFLRSVGLEPRDFDDVRNHMPGTPTLWEVIEEAFANAGAIVVLLTPDERVALHPSFVGVGDVDRWQSRANVLIEAGAAMSLDRKRTFLVKLGDAQWGSDFAGMHYRALGNDEKSRSDFRNSLNTVCAVNLIATDYLNSARGGDFEACLEGLGNTPVQSPFDFTKPIPAKSPAQERIDAELSKLAETLDVLHRDWRTEREPNARNYDRAKFCLRKLSTAFASHWAQLHTQGLAVDQTAGDSVVSVAKQLVDYPVRSGKNPKFWTWGDWVFSAVALLASNPLTAELPTEPSDESAHDG